MKYKITLILAILCAISYAQSKITGVVYDEYLEPFPNAKITVNTGSTSSNLDGDFSINIKDEFPQKISVSAFGYGTEIIEIKEPNEEIDVILKATLLIDEVVISASRTPERIIESPVTIERLSLRNIKNTASNSFYDAVTNLKGIDIREVGYTLKSVNARGFADFTNSRFIQLIDGVDSSVPALNYNLGNLGGITELDIDNVEILPGASSALYGANAYNGIMLLKTKNPFDYEGVSALFKSGITDQESVGKKPFYEIAVRAAHKFDDYFAGKVNFGYIKAEEWHANDTRNRDIYGYELMDGTVNSTLNYDGVNVYGDEFIIGTLEDGTYLRRTGYQEKELVTDYRIKNIKFSGALEFRPLKNDRLKIQLGTNISKGNNLFQGGLSRYAQRDYYFEQSKLEVNGSNFFLRSYYTRNDAGDSYDLTRTGFFLNSTSKMDSDWSDIVFNNYKNKSVIEVRALADTNRLTPNSPAFKKELKNITTNLIGNGGSKIFDTSRFIHTEGNYNFKKLLNNWADVQIGGSFRKYSPESRGTIFNDKNRKIKIEEYGGYTQIQKKFWEGRIKLTGSLRYDKSTNFEGNFSPRISTLFTLDEDKKHIIRSSYQTAFRNPTIQEQYVYSEGYITGVGGVWDNLKQVVLTESGVYDGFTSTITGADILNSILAEPAYRDNTFIEGNFKPLEPESVETFELGYRSLLTINNTTNLDIDLNGFYSNHNKFVFNQYTFLPKYGKFYPNGHVKMSSQEISDLEAFLEEKYYNYEINDPEFYYNLMVQNDVQVLDFYGALDFIGGDTREFLLVTNSRSSVQSYGGSLSLSTKILKNFGISANYNFMDFKYEDKDNGFEPNFNTPKHSVKVQVGNEKLFNNFGFNIATRWQDKYRWISPYVKGNIGARTVIDAQLNYRVPSMKSTFKIGGNNLFGKEYFVAPGTGKIGNTYYFSWTINN